MCLWVNTDLTELCSLCQQLQPAVKSTCKCLFSGEWISSIWGQKSPLLGVYGNEIEESFDDYITLNSTGKKTCLSLFAT